MRGVSQENVNVVRRMYDAFDAGDANAALAYFDADVVISMRATALMVESVMGVRNLSRSWVNG